MARMPAPRTAAPLADDDPPPRCGWFVSSLDLQDGLSVTEHVEPGAVAALVPLRWWLQWELEAAASSVGAGCGSSPPAAH